MVGNHTMAEHVRDLPEEDVDAAPLEGVFGVLLGGRVPKSNRTRLK
jgi:hypothetical protein